MASKKRSENLTALIDQYELVNGTEYTMAQVVDWAMQTGRMDPIDIEAMVDRELGRRASELADAARQSHERDPAGRKVRSYHSRTNTVRDDDGNAKQEFLWSSRERASWGFLTTACIQRHGGIRGDVTSLVADVESLNEFKRQPNEKPIQLDFDFNYLADEGGAEETA